MEETIENHIDHGLENIAPFLYIVSMIGGILLIIIGFILIMKKKTAPNDKKKIFGVLIIGIGGLALCSGLIQYFL